MDSRTSLQAIYIKKRKILVVHPSYIGKELELFQYAKNWKNYLKKKISPHLKGHVLEIGAGMGSNTKILSQSNPNITSWTCLEPDEKLAKQIDKQIKGLSRVIVGTSSDLKETDQFDTVVYLDVIEHISDEASELKRISDFLKPNGKLIVVSPAHQKLFSEFDRKIGHYRRYSKNSLLAVVPDCLKIEKIEYLDCLGFFLSLGNRLLFKISEPSKTQILFWDRVIVRVSFYVDPLVRHRFGRSIIGIWRKLN